MIEFNSLGFTYPNGCQALMDVNLYIEKGSFNFLTGHSGAGKTTLIRLIMGLIKPSRGNIIISGQNLSQIKQSNLDVYRRKMGLVFQDHQLLYDRSVYDNVVLPLLLSGYNSDDANARVKAALSRVLLRHKIDDNPGNLSVGEQQRVCIARAIVARPEVLLADEPTGNLDPMLSVEIMKIFIDFQDVGTTILVATHDVQLIECFNANVINLKEGRVT